MGFQLTDEERLRRIETTDKAYTVESYAARAPSRHFRDKPNLTDLAVDAFRSISSEGTVEFSATAGKRIDRRKGA